MRHLLYLKFGIWLWQPGSRFETKCIRRPSSSAGCRVRAATVALTLPQVRGHAKPHLRSPVAIRSNTARLPCWKRYRLRRRGPPATMGASRLTQADPSSTSASKVTAIGFGRRKKPASDAVLVPRPAPIRGLAEAIWNLPFADRAVDERPQGVPTSRAETLSGDHGMRGWPTPATGLRLSQESRMPDEAGRLKSRGHGEADPDCRSPFS